MSSELKQSVFTGVHLLTSGWWLHVWRKHRHVCYTADSRTV